MRLKVNNDTKYIPRTCHYPIIYFPSETFMAKKLVREFLINDCIVAPRLKGLKVVCTIDEENDKLNFDTEMPDNPTEEEKKYVTLLIEKIIDSLPVKYQKLIGKRTIGIK